MTNCKISSFFINKGKDNFYTDSLDINIRSAKRLYPGWTIRIYHDDSIDNSIICNLECSTDDHEVPLDNVDFCDIKQIPLNPQTTLDFSYILPMVWRWLPVGDMFVDLFISRDSDSCIFEREVSAVDEWLARNTLFHVMRDHPSHGAIGYEMAGGLWGLKTKLNRNLAKYFYGKVTSAFLSRWYKMYKGNKGQDQYLLNWYFWPYAKLNSTIHDSYTCLELGGKPFPTQRPVFDQCFVGSPGCCKESGQLYENVCPEACRPKKDWVFC